MVIKISPYMNDPALAQAASNLASLFEPPSGADVANYATADAKRAEMNRLAQYFQMSQDPNVDLDTLSRVGIGTGLLNFANSKYGVDQSNATQRYGYDRTFEASRLNNADDNARALRDREMQESGLMARQNASPIVLNQGQRAFLPAQTAEATELMQILDGASKPLNETEWTAQQNQRLLDNGRLTDQDLLDAITGDNTPVKAIDPRTKQPAYMTPGAAIRTGAQPYEAASAERVDNYLAAGPDGKEIRFPGIVGADGRIVNANTGQVVPNVVRKEGTGGGIKFEADGQGGVRFTTGGAGNTVSQQSNLQGQRDAATQSARELQTLFDNIAASDVGVAGNFNDFLTNYGGQVFPHVARGDVTAMRTQMQTTAMRMARSLAGDNRISDTDRRMAEDIMVGQGLGESLPGAKAKLATLIVLNAYRAKFAGSLASGDGALPPINGGVLGQLVDDGAITPAQADEYQRTMLSSNRGGPTRIPSVGELERDFDPAIDREPRAAPSGVDPADWEFMTPEQKALFR